jgi:uncharacterized membrane-anchored protein YitT (DUF2179 family)
MLRLVYDKRFSWKWFRNYGLLISGALIMACGYVFFLVPHKIVPGGVYGLSIVLHHIIGLPTGTTALVLNIPLLLWGIKELGPRFGIKTVLGMVLTSTFIDLITYGAGLHGIEALSQDLLLSSVFGGACVGGGLALVFRAKATTGGSDIIANIVYKRTRAPMGRTIILIDFVVVAFATIAFQNPAVVLYAIVTIFVTGRVLDAVLDGPNYQKAAFIVSAEYERIRKIVIDDLDRGGTLFSAKGLFQGDDRPVILTAISRRELAILEEQIKLIDPKAFIIIFDSKEVLGEGFRPLTREQ